MKRRTRYIPTLLISFVLVAFALRVYHLDYFSLWQDEGLTTLRAGYTIREILSNRIFLQEAVSTDTHPPLYFLLIHLSRSLFGSSDFAYRYPSVLAGILLVPLLYQFGRRLHHRRVGLVAASLAAVNPLQIWYGQEARMYTLLVLLSAGATYALWRALSSRSLLEWFLLYLLLAGLTFLTHYTAVFLIAAHSLFWIWLFWHRGQRRLLFAGGLVILLIILPFIPLTVPRLFTGAEANYTYVSPRTMLQDVVHGFGLGLTVDFEQWTVKAIDVGLALVLLAGIAGPSRGRGQRARLFLLAYLLAVMLGLALGSLIKPMYQGARHIIIGSPAFLLLLARGVFFLPRRPVPQLLLLFLLVGPILSVHNLYNDPQYAKDDLRGLVRYIEMRAGEGDVVVYNNAVLLPFHSHYELRSDLAVTALPVYPHPAGEDTEIRLRQLSDRYERLWFVADRPADGRDAQRLVGSWLEENLLQVERHRAHSLTMDVRVVAYATGPRRLVEIPPDVQEVERTWSDALTLRGWNPDFREPAALPTLWFELFWEGKSPPSDEIHLRFALRDVQDNTWVDENRPFWGEDLTELFQAPLIPLNYGLSLPVGMPPGPYELFILPWNQVSGETLGEWQSLGTVTLQASSAWPFPVSPPVQNALPLYFANGLQLVGMSSPSPDVRPGNALPLTLFWQTQSALPASDLTYELQVVGPGDTIWLTRSGTPGPQWFALQQWPQNSPVRDLVGLSIPAEAPPGRYRLRWRLLTGASVVPARPAWRPWRSEWVTFGTINVTAWPLNRTLPQSATKVEASFGPAIQLYGYDPPQQVLQAGDPIQLTLHWLAQDVPRQNYLVFVHVIGDDGEIVTQADRIPLDWKRPTRGWRAGEVLADTYELFLPPDLASGTYDIYVGLFNPDTEQRAPVNHEGRPQPDGRLLLTTVTVR